MRICNTWQGTNSELWMVALSQRAQAPCHRPLEPPGLCKMGGSHPTTHNGLLAEHTCGCGRFPLPSQMEDSLEAAPRAIRSLPEPT